MNRTLTGFCGLMLAASPLLAGPLDRAVVAKGAQWVFHMDVEAGLASTLGRYIVTHRADLHLEDIDRVKAEIGIDPLADIRGVTVYGMGPSERDGVAVVYATAAVDELIRKLKAKEDIGFEQLAVEGRTIYTWKEDGEARFAQVRPDGEGRVVIAAADQDGLLAGIRVFEGKGESMPKDAPACSPRPGSIVFASASHLPDAEALPFKHAESFTFDAGESGQEIYADLRVAATSSEEATNMSQIAMGAIAMAKFSASNNASLREAVGLLSGVSITCEQKDVVGSFRFPTAKINAVLAAIGNREKSGHKTVKTKDEKKDDAGSKN